MQHAPGRRLSLRTPAGERPQRAARVARSSTAARSTAALSIAPLMPPQHPALKVHHNAEWRDVHFANDEVRCTRYEVVPTAASVEGQLAEVGGALRAALSGAFEENLPLRVPGGRWSLSNIGRPEGALLDLSNYRRVGPVPAAWLTPGFRAASAASAVEPMLIAAGVTINVVNRELFKAQRALKTSGASDGQTFAGAIATGTHGADMRVGALHDTVLALHLVVSPTRSVLVQPTSGGLTSLAADTLAAWFGLPCELLSDDQLFRAAQVHLGSLGVVLHVIVETVPLYYLSRQRTPQVDGKSWRAVLKSRDPSRANGLHSADPDCLQFIVNPYSALPDGGPRVWMSSMCKRAFEARPDVVTMPTDVSLKSDLADFLPSLVSFYQTHDAGLPGHLLLREVTSSQLRGLYGSAASAEHACPGAMFGPPDFLGIDFSPVRGASAEYVFDAEQAQAAVSLVLDTLQAQADAGNQYLGGIGVRFVKGSEAWLAPNAKPMNCFVELQSLYTAELPAIHAAITASLAAAGIAHCGHWGQWFMNTPQVAARWWGQHSIDAWKAARADLLPTSAARAIFASPILPLAGLA